MKLLKRIGDASIWVPSVLMCLFVVLILTLPAEVLLGGSLAERISRIEELELEIAKGNRDAHIPLSELQREVDLLNEEAYALHKLLVDTEKKSP